MREPAERPLLPRALAFPRHFRIYAGVSIAAIALNLTIGLGLPLFWPIAAWTTLVAVHYFIASSLDVEEDWVEEKAEDLRMRSYDFGHIDDIKDRIHQRDHSVVHHEERDRPSGDGKPKD